MADKILFIKNFSIQAGDFPKAGEASVEIKNILKEVGFDLDVVRRVAIASYEAEMNVVMYSVGGEISLSVKPDEVYLVFQDNGPGIPDINLAMKEGYSTATEEMREMGFGAGMGLPNMKKNADRFNIISDLDQGTRLEMHFQSH